MLTVSQLLQFDPAPLQESAGQWRLLAGGVLDQGGGLQGAVRAWLDPHSWDGAAATAARGQVDGLSERFTHQAGRLQQIAATLDSAATGLAQARSVLQGVVATAGSFGLTVNENGTVAVGSAANVSDPAQAGRLRMIAAQLTATAVPVLEAATGLDVSTAAALRTDPQSFSGTGSRGFASSTAIEDAERAAEIVNSGTFDDDDLLELETLLRDNAGDPEFAGTFYSAVGPEGALYFVDSLASNVGHTPGVTTVGSIQASMGTMLAMVTDQDSSAYLGQEWTDQLLESDVEQVDYPALGVLLNSGDYSTDFLLATAEKFEEFEDGDSSRWVTPGERQLNFIGFPETNGYGSDPMTGLFSAFGRNAEASSQFFDPAANPERIEYYLHEREGILTGIEQPFDSAPSFYNTLGQALESAVSGDPHDARSAHIMSETVHVLGDLELRGGDVPENMRDSVANMAAEYIGDVNAAFTYDHAPGYPPPDGQAPDFDLDFSGAMDVPSANEAHALFDQSDLLRAMAGTAEDPDAYATMYNAQAGYTGLVVGTTAIDTTLSEQERADEIAVETEKLAYVFGALDEARASAVEDQYTSADAAHNANAAIGERILGGLGGLLWDELSDPIPGDKILKQGLDPLIDMLFGEQDTSEQMAREIATIYQGGSEQAFTISQMIMEMYGLWDESENLKLANASGYDAGAGDMARALGES